MGVLAVRLLLLVVVGGAVQRVAGRHPYYFELLAEHPFGVKDTCLPLGASCSTPGSCCTGGCSDEDACCKLEGSPCTSASAFDDTCCTGWCDYDNQCREEPGCGRMACLGATAQVRILEPPGIAALKDVKVGQHIECVGTDDELRLPASSTYCEVINWVHAQNKPVVQYRVSFTRPDGSRHTKAANFVTKLDRKAAALTTPVARMAQFGSFKAILAKELAIGDKIVVLADENNPKAGFTAAKVTKVERVKEATYLPAIDKPYMVVDGVVTALWVNHKVPVDEPLVGADQAVQHMLYSPLWMTRQQAVGTVAREGQWRQEQDGEILVFSHAATNINHAKHAGIAGGQVLSYAATKQWFQPRYAAWKADPSKAITEADVLEFLGSDGAWVAPRRGARGN